MNTTTTTADIEAELIDLYNLMEEKDKEISKLKQDVAVVKTEAENNDNVRSPRPSRSSSNKDRKLKQCRTQLSECKEKVVDLEARLKQSQLDQQTLVEEKVAAEQKVQQLQSKLCNQRDTLQSKSKFSKEQSNDQYRLEVENQKLRNAVTDLETNEEDLITEVEQLTAERDDLDRKCRTLADDRDRLGLEFDRYVQGRSTDKDDRTEMEERTQAAVDENADLREEIRLSQEAYECEISSLQADLDKARRDSVAIEEQAALSYNAQKQKALESEVGNLRDEVRRVREDLKRCTADKDRAERDLEKTCKALADSGKECEDRIHEALVKERMQVQEVEVRLQAAAQREKDMDAARLDLQRQKDEVALQLSRSEERNAWYEEGHGLADAVRYQKKLEAGMFRRDHDVQQLQNRIDKEVGRCKVLQKTVLLLKEKADLANDPALEEDAVREAMAAHDNQLQAQNTELSRQIQGLEADRLAMMKQLRHNAAEISEKGIKFLGLDAAQIQKVMEFASNVRDGSVNLPLDDRSRELKDELVAVKAEQKTDKVTIERLERDLIGLRGCDANHVKATAEIESLKQSLDQAQIQNKVLQDEISSTKEEAAKIRLAHEAGAEDVLPPAIRERAKDILGEPLANMSNAAQVQFLCLVNKCDEVSAASSSCSDSDGKDKPSAHSALHLQSLEQKMANCNVSSDTSLYKDVRTMASQLAECTAKLAAREQEAASKNGLLRQYESEIKTMREQVATMLHPAPQPNPPATDTFAINVNNKLPLTGGVEQLHALQKELVSVRESAQGRMAQLKALLDEKNATIERYRQKLLQTGAHNLSSPQPTGDAPPPSATRPQNDSCHSSLSNESETTVAKLRRAVTNTNLDCDSEAGSEARISLVKQVDTLAALVRDKEARIYRLETNLRDAVDGRTTSEKRCNDALHEMDRIKGDMQSLAHLIKDSEGRMVEASAASRQVTSLQGQLEEKEDAIQRLGSQLSRLKARYGTGSKAVPTSYEQQLIDEAKMSQMTAEISKVKRQLTSTRLAKRKCEDELEQAKAKSAEAAVEVTRMEQEVAKFKQVAIDARQDKENASSRAVRAVTKLKEIQNADETQKRELERVQELEKKVASLLRKNAGLRGQLAASTKDQDVKADTVVSSPSGGDQAKKVKTLEKRLEERRAECKKLRDDLDSMRKTRQKERAIINELRSSIKTLEDENEKLTTKKDVGTVGACSVPAKPDDHLETELKRLQDEVTGLKLNRSVSPKSKCPSSSSPAPDVHHQHLKDDLDRAEREKQSLADKLRTTSLAEQRLQSKIVNLESEKAMLHNELKSFDLDFFEEIEDLKFKYSSVCKQLKKQKASSSSGDGAGDDAVDGLGPWSDLVY